jgi:hypothetical protein
MSEGRIGFDDGSAPKTLSCKSLPEGTVGVFSRLRPGPFALSYRRRTVLLSSRASSFSTFGADVNRVRAADAGGPDSDTRR